MKQGNLRLTEKLVSPGNIKQAIDKVVENKGAPGVDDMTVFEVEQHILKYRRAFIKKLKNGTYTPQPVKRVYIPKSDGSKRELGIPVARDRVVQKMILQIINPLIDKHFSDQSYGFRPGEVASKP